MHRVLRSTEVGAAGLEAHRAVGGQGRRCKKSQRVTRKVYELSLNGPKSGSGLNRKRGQKAGIPGQGASLHVQRHGDEMVQGVWLMF